MIIADANYAIRTGTKTQLRTAVELYLQILMDPPQEFFKVYVGAFNSGTQVDGAIFMLSRSEITAESATGSDEIDKLFNQIEKATATKLAALPENSGVSFTVS